MSLEEDALHFMIPDIAGDKVYGIERGELDAVLAYIDELAEGEDLKEIFDGDKTASSYYTSWLKKKKIIAS